MKKLEMNDAFECTPDEFWDTFFDPGFTAALDALIGFKGREELSRVEDGEKIHVRSRVTPKGEVPPHIQDKLNNGLRFLQQMVNAPSVPDLPEPMRKAFDWGRSAFKDFLNRDPKSTTPAKPAQLNFTYVEDQQFTRADHQMRWSITPELFKDVTTFKGTMKVEPTEGGCRRVIDGEISLNLPGVGETVETFLIDEIARGHVRAAELTRQWIEEKRQRQA